MPDYSILDRLARCEGVLSPDDVAVLFNVSPKTVYKLAAKPAPVGLPSFHFGSLLKFDPSALAHWVRKQSPAMVVAQKSYVTGGIPAPLQTIASEPQLIAREAIAGSPKTEMIHVSTFRIGEFETQSVDARELHAFLGVGKFFANWIKDRIGDYGFIQGRDFEVFANSGNNLAGGRPAKEYALTLDMAKELSMVERTDKGQEARRYFIECERKLLAQPARHGVPAAESEDSKMLNFFLKRELEILQGDRAELSRLVTSLSKQVRTLPSSQRRAAKVLPPRRMTGFGLTYAIRAVLNEAGGRVDIDTMIADLEQAGVNLGTYPLRNVMITLRHRSNRHLFHVESWSGETIVHLSAQVLRQSLAECGQGKLNA